MVEFVVIEKEIIIRYSEDEVISGEHVIEIVDSPDYVDDAIDAAGYMINRKKLLLKYIPFKPLGELGFMCATSNSGEWLDGEEKHIILTYVFQKFYD